MSFPGADDLLGGPNNPREPDADSMGVRVWEANGGDFWRNNVISPDEWGTPTHIAYPLPVAEQMARVIAESREALDLILRCIRNSRDAPNVLDTIGFAARNGLNELAALDAMTATPEATDG